jgi:hypothetical protein
MSTYQEQAGRLSFLDLPAELRNDTYKKALSSPGPAKTWKLTLVGEQVRCQILLTSGSFYEDFTISTLKMLSAVSKQVRDEAQSLF